MTRWFAPGAWAPPWPLRDRHGLLANTLLAQTLGLGWPVRHGGIRPLADPLTSRCKLGKPRLEKTVMGKKVLDRSKTGVAEAERLNIDQAHADSMSDIPDFTQEQWEWLKKQSAEREKGYLPTRSLIPGL